MSSIRTLAKGMRRFIATRLPDPLYFAIQRLRGRTVMRSAERDCVHDLETIQIQDHMTLDVYWFESEVGVGPAASLYVYDDEVMRLDCFGGDAGHLHFNMRQSSRNGGGRFYFLPGTIEEHIDRATFDLTRNFDFCQRRNRIHKIRHLDVDCDQLERAAELMSVKMHELLAQRVATVASDGGR